MLGFAAGDFEIFESCSFRRFRGQTLRLSIPLDAGGRPALRNICKIAKFVDTAENELRKVFLFCKCFIFRIDCLAVYAPAIFLFSLSSKGPEAPVLHEGRARALSTRDILETSRKHRLSNKSATASSPRIRPYSV